MRLLILLAVLLMAVPAASAQNWDCADSGNLPQQGMNYCAGVDFEEADRAMNVAWKHVKTEIDTRDADMPEQWQGWGAVLLKAQRAWLEYRDAHCESEGFQFRGGTMEPLIVASCKAHETRMRTQELLLLIAEY